MNINRAEKPNYLNGTFNWRGLGYSFNSEPPKDLFSHPANQDNPWSCIGQFLACCRNGEVPDTDILQIIVQEDNINDPLLLQACYDLLGDTARKGEIEFLERLMKTGSKNQKLSAAWTAQWTASLALIPAMIYAFKSFTRTADKETISAAISNILEDEECDVELYDYEGNDESYATLVMQRTEELLKKWPGYERFYSGKPLDTLSLITRFRDIVFDIVNKDKMPQTSLIILRRWFETATGSDCSHMFSNQRFNPQAALDILDDWIDSNTVEYIKGYKYFFGAQCI